MDWTRSETRVGWKRMKDLDMALAAANSRRVPLRIALPARLWILALLDGTSAMGLGAIVAAPLGGSAPTGLYAGCACALALAAATLMLLGTRIGPGGLLVFAGLRIVVVGLTLTVAQNGGATLFGGAGMIWVALWTTTFYSRRTLVSIIAAEAATATVAVIVNPDHVRTAIDALPMITGAILLSLLLAHALGSLRHEARHDELTGLMNRRGLDQALRELSRGRRFAASAHSLVVIDLDGLKLVNDHAGHLAGDQMLVTFATELQTAARGVDLTARVGGDEFIAILPGIAAADAHVWAERLHATSGVAWSYGVAERSSGEELEAWLNRADKLMYAAKTATRAARARTLPAPA